jgi:hypothetical protein
LVAPGLPDSGLAAGECLLLRGIPNAEYHARPEISKTQGWDFRRRGPVWFNDRHVTRNQPPFASGALQRGTLVHLCLELGPAEFWRQAVEVPEQYLTSTGALSQGKEAKAWRADQPAEAILVPPSDAFAIRKIVEQLFANAATRDIYERVVEHELSCIYRRTDGHAIRCRFDAQLDDGSIVDWKSSRDEHPLATWASSAIDHGYHYQDAWYSQCAEAAGLIPGITFVVLSTTSFQVQAVTLPPHAVDPCHQQITDDLEEIEERKATDNWLWRGYGETHVLDIPSHLLRRYT